MLLYSFAVSTFSVDLQVASFVKEFWAGTILGWYIPRLNENGTTLIEAMIISKEGDFSFPVLMSHTLHMVVKVLICSHECNCTQPSN